jgi:integrase
MRKQFGCVYPVRNAKGKVVSWHLRYRVTEERDGKLVRVLKSCHLVNRDERHHSKTCKPVTDLAEAKMRQLTGIDVSRDMAVVEFWENTYLPFITENKKPSTVSGYSQIWSQHLRAHFVDKTLTTYETHMGTNLLLNLSKTLGLRTLNHIRSLGSGIFTHAVNVGLIKLNPWHEVKMLGKIRPPKGTKHYTLEEAENIISALVDHVDCQLVMALACFLGLRASEVSGLKWEDFDSKSVNIRRAVVRGVVGTPKTAESLAALPLLDQVRVPLELWRAKSGGPVTGWVFENKNGRPAYLRDMVARTIRPTLKAAGLEWKGLQSGRRGAGTAIIGLTGGNFAAAQELLRHKHMSTTLQFYKRQTKTALEDGVRALESALKPMKQVTDGR